MKQNKHQQFRVVEVGPRDGLQNEKEPIDTEVKYQFIMELLEAGLKEIEITSFVRPDKIPQLSDASELVLKLSKVTNLDSFWCLVPNLKGLEKALDLGITNIAVFTSVSETFNQKNINISVNDATKLISEIAAKAKKINSRIKIRCYISMVFGCPYEGNTVLQKVAPLINELKRIEIDEFSFGDTIGVAYPQLVKSQLDSIVPIISKDKISLHFHDTKGMALLNVQTACQYGISSFDSSAGGMGGCPFAKGATGNLATEDLLEFLKCEFQYNEIDSIKVANAASKVFQSLKKSSTSKMHHFLMKKS